MTKSYIRKESMEDLIFKNDIMKHMKGEYAWCLHCERAFKKELIRFDQNTGLYMCVFEDCNGDALFDMMWSYDDIRELHPNYPLIPIFGKQYPMY